MGDGKKGQAPCGHSGEAVIGHYYECAIRCDGKFVAFDLPQCKDCGSFNIDEDFQVDPMFYYYNPGVEVVDTRCNACGKVWTR